MVHGQVNKDAVFIISEDRELYSADIAFLLLSADSALGQRGTLSAVVAAIQRGGGASSAAYDHSTDEQLGGRWGCDPNKGGPASREGMVNRSKRCLAKWHALPARHRRTHMAHYLGTISASTKVVARFGNLAGVVVEHWCQAARAKHEAGAAIVRARLEDERRLVRAELDPLEARLRRASAEARRCHRWAFPPTEPRSRTDPAGAFRAWSATTLTERSARRLRTRLGALLAASADLAAQPSHELDLRALDAACERGDTLDVAGTAERAIRAAHRAWHGRAEAFEAAELLAAG